MGLPLAVVAISTSGILIRLTASPPLVTAANRLLLAALILLAIALIWQRQDLRSIDRRRLLLIGASGLLLGLHLALWTTSLFWTSVASAVLLADTHPVLVALAARAFLRERTGLGVWAGIGLTLAGSAIIGAGDLGEGARALAGDAMALGASATFAGYLVIGRSVRPGLGLAAYTGLVYGAASIALMAAASASGASLTEFDGKEFALWTALVLVPTLGGHTVFNWTLRYVPVAVVGVAVLGEPVVTTVLAALLLGEPPKQTAILGGAVIMAGIYVALRAQSPTPAGGGGQTGSRPDPK
ncbi:MAG: protein of unknown function transrane [Chloroflexi bacterium]|nr:protein of unknown function transrane [Chloroflexota bacterium]